MAVAAPDDHSNGNVPDRLFQWRTALVLGLLVFGLTLGLLAALSKHGGITATLIGLLVALIGRSLAPLIKSDKSEGINAEQRGQLFCAAGLVCTGLLGGLALAFSLRWVEGTYWISSERKAYVDFLSNLKKSGLLAGGITPPSPPSTLMGENSVFDLHSYGSAESATDGQQTSPPNDAKKLLAQCDTTLDRLAKSADQELIRKLTNLRGYLAYSASSQEARRKALDEIIQSLKGSDNLDVKQFAADLESWAKQF
jgi:hypothetical protein